MASKLPHGYTTHDVVQADRDLRRYRFKASSTVATVTSVALAMFGAWLTSGHFQPFSTELPVFLHWCWWLLFVTTWSLVQQGVYKSMEDSGT